VRGKLLLIVTAVAALLLGGSLAGCSSWPSEDAQVQQFVTLLEKGGHKVDQVSDAKPARDNASWETETKKVKKRNINGKLVDVKKGAKIAEVVVVAPGSNCKFELELVLNQKPTDAYYADEGRDAAGKETALDSKFNTDKPSPSTLKQYVKDHDDRGGPLAFCAGKPYVPSSHADD